MNVVYNDGRMYQIAFSKNELVDGMVFEEYLCHGINELMDNNRSYLKDEFKIASWKFESDHTCCMFLLKMMSRDFGVPVSDLYGKRIHQWITRRYGVMGYFSELAARLVREKYGLSLHSETYGIIHADIENLPEGYSILRYIAQNSSKFNKISRSRLITELIKNNMEEDEQLILTFTRIEEL